MQSAAVSIENQPYELHPANILEAIASVIGDEPALAHGPLTRTWSQYVDRAARLAGWLADRGVGPASKVAILMYNCPEWLETHLASLKIRAVPINVNYRYVKEELRYLLNDSDAEAIVFHSSLSRGLEGVVDSLPNLKARIRLDDGEECVVKADAYEEIVGSTPPMDPVPRFADDYWMTYTGGTTGIPKGVVSRVGRVAPGLMRMGFGGLGAEIPQSIEAATNQVIELRARYGHILSVIAPPLMHPTGLVYGAIVPHFAGGCAITLEARSYRPEVVIDEVEKRRATNLVIAGEVFCRPLVDALDHDEEKGRSRDLTSLRSIFSSGMILSNESKARLLRHAVNATLVDVVGSSEGAIGSSTARKGSIPPTGLFDPLPTTKVIAPDGSEVTPGSGVPGILAASGNIVGDGYYKDVEKSARTYRIVDGERYAMAGDWATVEADGRIRFLGRESACINTGGEKVYAEEVEDVIKEMPSVVDCLVVPTDDPRWGSVVTAVIQLVEGSRITPADVKEFVQRQLAGYKAPRRILFTDRIPRAANGKADYKTARAMAVDAVEVKPR